MPHLTLHHSANITETNLINFFAQAHELLACELPTAIDSVKSRGIAYPNYHLGNGKHDSGFIYLEITVLPGRSPQVLQQTAQKILDLIKLHLAQTKGKLKIDLSVELRELSPYYTNTII